MQTQYGCIRRIYLGLGVVEGELVRRLGAVVDALEEDG